MKFEDVAFYDQILKYVKRKEKKDFESLSKAAKEWLRISYENKIYYDWTWLGIPIIQTPSDMMIIQELIFRLRPKTLIETGVAHGGSLIFYSSILNLIHGSEYSVIGIEIDFRLHNQRILEKHPLYKNVHVIKGDSTSITTIQKIKDLQPDISGNVIVVLDSYHGKDHVLKELELYSDFVNVGGYILVCDTVMDILEGIELTDKTVSRYNGPKSAIDEFLEKDTRFVIDENCNKLFISHAYNGFLKKIRD